MNEAWIAGALILAVPAGLETTRAGSLGVEVPTEIQELSEERMTIIAADGHMPPAEAERLAWAGLQAQAQRREASAPPPAHTLRVTVVLRPATPAAPASATPPPAPAHLLLGLDRRHKLR